MNHIWTGCVPVSNGPVRIYSEGVTQSKPGVVRLWRTTLGLVGSCRSTLKELHSIAVRHFGGTPSGFKRFVCRKPRVPRLAADPWALAVKLLRSKNRNF